VDADIVITSASAPAYLLTRLEIEQAMRLRRNRPLCVVDLGVPRNVEPGAGTLENVYAFDVDDLHGVVAHVHRERQQAVEASRRIIDQKAAQFLAWWQEEVQCAPSGSAPVAAP
jgi:glutamyl-tRNA reductase